LTEAIALAHDLGHPPFGHAGETALNEAMAPWGGFRHDAQSLRVVDRLEQRRRADGVLVAGLNLTWEVRNGIGGHSKGLRDLREAGEDAAPVTLEGQIVRLADRVAYVHHDTDDAIRAGLITEEDVPRVVTDVLGASRARWLDALVHDVVAVASGQEVIDFSPTVREALNRLKDFLAVRVYFSPSAQAEAARGQRLLRGLFDYFFTHPEELPVEAVSAAAADPEADPRSDPATGRPLARAVCDYLAGMTDRFAVKVFAGLFLVQGLDGR
jgi:dGTPase